jgi:hypothetical protein
MKQLPELPPISTVAERLDLVFAEGSPHRGYCTRDLAARTVFVMLYVGAVQGKDRWPRPDQVTRMTAAQAARRSATQRERWAATSLAPAKRAIPGRWYAANTREPIRDETLREGLVPSGAVVVRENVPTTSPLPRYALAAPFYLDRDAGAFKKTGARLAWGTFAWFVSEPDDILLLHGGSAAPKRYLWELMPAEPAH